MTRSTRTDQRDIVLVTCVAWPGLSASDTQLANELTALGHRVRSCPWNAAPIGDFASADLVVLRSNWDFHHDLDAFATWLDQIEQSDTALHNSAGLVRAYLDKSYLAGLAAEGFRTPHTLFTHDFDLDEVRSWVDGQRLDQVVDKGSRG